VPPSRAGGLLLVVLDSRRARLACGIFTPAPAVRDPVGISTPAARDSSGNPRKFTIMVYYMPGIYPTYDDIQYTYSIYLLYTWNIPVM
jgi:hypothetical protein